MRLSTNIRRGKICVFLMHVRLVFVIKYRENVFKKSILENLQSIFASICKDFEAKLVEYNGEGDEDVHLLVDTTRKLQSGNSLIKGPSFTALKDKSSYHKELLIFISKRRIINRYFPFIFHKFSHARKGIFNDNFSFRMVAFNDFEMVE